MKLFLFLLNIFLFSVQVFAGEGMWIPLLLENRVIADMQAAGLKLSATDIYNINQACLKDAVILFGKGCTGELISPDGLLITNHHCGYGRIQAHSTLENDYLTDGFWAYSRNQELPNPGLTVSFLVRIEDVTEKILRSVRPDMSDRQRAVAIDSIAETIVADAVMNTHYEAEIESFYFGSDYFLFVYEVFRDIRLVGTPPSSIGKFGGDSDNWLWPRHTGDFCLFRIYAGIDNAPAPYSPENVPYKPKKYLTISTKGVQEGDFTMVIGYPGRTDEYLYSEGLAIIADEILPAKIKMREERLRIMAEEMSKSPEIKLQYANIYQGVSNAWKKWEGIVEGVKRTGVIHEKIRQEKRLADGHLTDTPSPALFTPVLRELHEFYTSNKTGIITSDLGHEAISSFEILPFTYNFIDKTLSLVNYDTTHYVILKDKLKSMANDFYKNVDLNIDRRTMPGILEIYFTSADPLYYPEIYKTIRKKFNGNIQDYVDYLYKKSLFTHPAKLNKTIDRLSRGTIKKLLSDPVAEMYQSFANALSKYYPVADSLSLVRQRLYKDYLDGLFAQDTNRLYYPDANFTMRIAYGRVEGYKAADAITYNYFTTTDGIIEKEDPEIADYKVNERLKQLIEKKDFGPYGTNAILPVCFIASNHTSGGNSGSPVLNAEGCLIGINFDRNWEGTISDYKYDPAVCRNISLDIRYVLFIIDKYAGASNILQELTIE
ncbi:MAG: S46 family peptidase [Bacteroidales bacterium]|nr:S46 family peptidase [Bacteroidales bacterium]